MTEEILASVKANPHIQPELSIWGSEITAYLFLNGLTAGAMILAASVILLRQEERAPFAAYRLPLVGAVAINVAMAALTLDLERIPMAWRFFTSIQMTSSMSRGSWALMVVIPMIILLALAQLRRGYPWLATLLLRIPLVGRLIGWIMDLAHAWRWWLAGLCLLLGIDLGLHTGVMLSSFNARPFWYSSILPPLTLAAGIVGAGAAVVLATTHAEERRLFARVSIGAIVAELILIALFVELMHSGSAMQKQAVGHVLGGDYTAIFWLGVVAAGLLLPLLLVLIVSFRPLAPLAIVASLLLLGGGVLFSQITLELGQKSSWTHVQNQFNPELLKLLTSRPGATHAD
jgi:formate-dependent nitrite reductase membrane component NrfD